MRESHSMGQFSVEVDSLMTARMVSPSPVIARRAAEGSLN